MRNKGRSIKFYTGSAHFVGRGPRAYLWCGDDKGHCIGWFDPKQLDAICRQWQERKKARP